MTKHSCVRNTLGTKPHVPWQSMHVQKYNSRENTSTMAKHVCVRNTLCQCCKIQNRLKCKITSFLNGGEDS